MDLYESDSNYMLKWYINYLHHGLLRSKDGMEQLYENKNVFPDLTYL